MGSGVFFVTRSHHSPDKKLEPRTTLEPQSSTKNGLLRA
jgi:hypothetical protein